MDLNADLGESFGRWTPRRRRALVPHLTSANLACGFHAGDFRVMEATVALCRRAGVAVGAQPGYPGSARVRPAADALRAGRRSSRSCATRSALSRPSAARRAWRCSTSSRTARSTTRRRRIWRWRRAIARAVATLQPRPAAVRARVLGADGVGRRRCGPALRARRPSPTEPTGRRHAPAARRARIAVITDPAAPPREAVEIATGGAVTGVRRQPRRDPRREHLLPRRHARRGRDRAGRPIGRWRPPGVSVTAPIPTGDRALRRGGAAGRSSADCAQALAATLIERRTDRRRVAAFPGLRSLLVELDRLSADREAVRRGLCRGAAGRRRGRADGRDALRRDPGRLRRRARPGPAPTSRLCRPVGPMRSSSATCRAGLRRPVRWLRAGLRLPW